MNEQETVGSDTGTEELTANPGIVSVAQLAAPELSFVHEYHP